MSGIRVAVFSKYFAAGALCSVAICARHCSYLITASSVDVQERFASIGRYAAAAGALEEYVESSGISIRKLTRETLKNKVKEQRAIE